MKTRSIRRILAWTAALCLLAALLPGVSAADDLADTAVLTFSEAGIAETAPGSGYSVSGTTLTIQAAGVYRIKGSCSEGSVVISKGVSGVTLIFDNLSLASAATAPVVIKKSCAVILRLEGVRIRRPHAHGDA